MADDELPRDETKLTTTKRKWAAEGRFLTGHIARSSEDRLPPGQHLVKNWPVLDLGQQPVIDTSSWKLEVSGEVETGATFNWQSFNALPQRKIVSDIHCVTTWSRYDNEWLGVATRDLLDFVIPKSVAHYVVLTSYDGYTTNVPLADFAVENALLAHSWQGLPLTRDHGGPLRLVIPHLYFWKSAKWIHRIDFRTQDEAGFWERNGYHMRGDPWGEQRYSDD
ncbi:sulfite oxidase-like oxidoreductase [Rhizobiaceae bacterium n13]|uniref:Sulfite oxidase-like oxidoreductase n=1 Tax=Ferirhizobium litorale TaxID=2927786 RepID=A0AAE3U1F8_9HYPH|nr:sulfite oxidase-like oxidoreductase [Fererhizobium litorale]MDI7863171.1 sulfite oxidase-like oxidoreductase [Fererhizobium litorale]MDI7923094.1 sulfite oxidase-like oxidoreductase [Fererhizobium litorale]